MSLALIDQWIAANGPLPPLTVGNGTDPVANAAAGTAQSFRNRVSMAITAAAIAVANEAVTVADHANRAALAKLVAGNPGNWAGSFAQALASLGLDDSSTDAAITGGVASVWDVFAG